MPEPHLSVTIAVCTFRRLPLLRATLRCLVRQEYPRHRFEIVVVDNDPEREDARAVVDAFADAPVAPKYIHHHVPGLSHARNRAATFSAKDIIVFVDDDIVAEADWLQQLVAPFQDDRAEHIGAVGGEVIPVFVGGVSRWGTLIYQPLKLRIDVGPIRSRQMLMGANMAFRRRALIEVGLFDPSVGRRGQLLLAGDENQPIERLRRQGFEIWFAPHARVFHQMPESRTTVGYALRHGFDSARSRVVTRTRGLDDAGTSALPFLLSRLVLNMLKLPLLLVQLILLLITLQRSATCPVMVRAARCVGYVRQITESLVERAGFLAARKLADPATLPLRANAVSEPQLASTDLG